MTPARPRPMATARAGALLAALAAGCGTPEPLPPTVTHGPILGRLSATEVGVWARTRVPGSFRVRYGPAPERLGQLSGAAATSPDSDNAAWVRLTGLEPDTDYFYRLEADGEVPPAASFRTLPDPSVLIDPTHNPRGLFNFSFEFACGNNQSGPDQPAFRTMLRDLDGSVHFSIQNGDWLYEEERDYSPSEWIATSGAESLPRKLRIAPAMAGAWENYKLYLTRGADMAAWHREMPAFFVFDDHEILGDVNGTGTVGLRARRPAFRDIGVQAWYDYVGWANPVDHTQGIHFGRAQLEEGSEILRDPEGGLEGIDPDKAATLTVHWGEPDAGVNLKELDDRGGDPNAGVYGIEEILDDRALRIRPGSD